MGTIQSQTRFIPNSKNLTDLRKNLNQNPRQGLEGFAAACHDKQLLQRMILCSGYKWKFGSLWYVKRKGTNPILQRPIPNPNQNHFRTLTQNIKPISNPKPIQTPD